MSTLAYSDHEKKSARVFRKVALEEKQLVVPHFMALALVRKHYRPGISREELGCIILEEEETLLETLRGKGGM